MGTPEELRQFTYSIPKGGDKVYKDECIFCFDDPTSENGLYVCLSNLQGFCQEHVNICCQKTRNSLFLHTRKIAKEKEISQESSEPPPLKKPTKLAIGVEGGFDVEQDKIEYDEFNSVIVLDQNAKEMWKSSLPNPDLPDMAQLSIAAVIAHEGSVIQDQISAWEGEKRKITKHADTLQQLDNGVKIPPRGWKCSKCDKVDNLWMNLTDGTIVCGRKYYDGSGGNNHAVEYYQETKYPLTVKLGTITPDGADIYSYDEDDMVEDPNLATHLAHFGINLAQMEKTDKTMTELEIQANLKLKLEWDTIQESGKKLTPLHGPGYTGINNLGNSCYMNSIMQVLFTTEEFQSRYAYAHRAAEIFKTSLADPPSEFSVQMAKLGHGLLSGKYSLPLLEDGKEDPKQGVTPLMFKSLVGKGHAEFSSNRQQDAQEFLMHLMELVERNERVNKGELNPRDSFAFEFEDRVQCTASNKVTYKKREDICWVLPIPLEAATNKDEYEQFEQKRKQLEENKQSIELSEVIRLKVPMSSCIEAFKQQEIIDGFYSSAINGRTRANKTIRFATFPDYLVVQMRRFTIGEDWVPKKLDVSIDVMEELDLSNLRGSGLQSGEEELPDEVEVSQEPQIDENLALQLVEMGFPLEGCRKGVYHTKNSGLEAAMNWVLEHSGDPDFAEPLKLGTKKKSQSFSVNDEALTIIMSMGFTRDQAMKALKATNNNVERAADWIFSHMDQIDSMEVDNEPGGAGSSAGNKYRDGLAKYRLFAFVSHMGTSTSCGHYVCHIFKDGKWVIFNDRKVAISEAPPKDLAYLYFYKRLSS